MDFTSRPLHFCVLIPCYNDEAGLVAALKSIHYDPAHYLAVVVDDGSREAVSYENVRAQAGDRPIYLLRLPQNRGITEALNAGLQWITTATRAPYIARLDCNDTCAPDRFYKQVAYLNGHPGTGLLGTWCRFGEEATGIAYSYTTPTEHEAIKKAMHLRNVFIHPTVMFRTVLLPATGFYPDQYPHTEDYAFFWKMLQVSRGAILPEFLVTCAITRTGISFSNRKKQLEGRKKVVSHFSENMWIKIVGLVKLNLLGFLPKTLLLLLKNQQK